MTDARADFEAATIAAYEDKISRIANAVLGFPNPDYRRFEALTGQRPMTVRLTKRPEWW